MNDPHCDHHTGDILVVDDDLPSLRVLSNLLAEKDYQVRSARDGPTALMLATSDPPELICLDVNMPGMNGFEVCRRLKNDPKTCDVPVIFISGLDEIVDKLQGFEAGGVDYIIKPFNIDEVEARVKTHLTLYQLQRQLDQSNQELQREIQEREVVQAALTASRATLKAQYDGIPIPTYTWQRQGDDAVLVDYNAAAASITQSTIGDYIGVQASGMYKDRPEILEDLLRCLAEEISFEREIEYTFISIGQTKHLAVKYAFVPPDLALVHTEDVTVRKRAEQELRASQQFTQASLDALSANIAILDEAGTIIAVNASWRSFAVENGFTWGDYGVGRNYLTVAELAASESDPYAPRAVAGIRAVIAGQQEAFWLEYPCHSPETNRWFVMRVTRFESTDGLRVVISHEDVTERQRLHDFATYLQAAREEERRRIAREIHDELGQGLTALNMDINWLANQLPPDRSDLVELTDTMSELVDSTINTVQRLATELRPGLLDDLGLAPAIEWQAQQLAERAGFACELKIDHDVVYDRELSTTMFRIFQEALTNIARHAKATQVKVKLTCDTDGVLMVIHDNGRGITQVQVADFKSLGLLGMQERARAMGGNISIEGKANQGTTVTVHIPHQNNAPTNGKQAPFIG